MQAPKTKICVLGGAGYVGLITGVGFAVLGNELICADIDAHKIANLSKAIPPIHEPQLPQLLTELIKTQKISFTTDTDRAIREAAVIIIAVGTPALRDGKPDISQATEAVKKIAANLNAPKLLIIKSTLPIGIRDQFANILETHVSGKTQLEIAFNPEFLREGSGIYDFFNCERIVVGSHSKTALKQVAALYAPLIEGSYKNSIIKPKPNFKPHYIETDPISAQTIKYASNAYLATRVSFVNEIAGLAEQLNGETKLILKSIGLDSRIGGSYLQPGPGFGGPCLEKDISALIALAETNDYNPILLKSVLERNRLRLNGVARDIKKLTNKDFSQLSVCVLGIAFKSNTNDARTSLSVRLIKMLHERGTKVIAGDPLITAAQLQKIVPQVKFTNDPYEATAGVDVVVIMNDDPAYTQLDYAKVAQNGSPIIYDTRYCLNRAKIEAVGLKYAVTKS